MRISEFHVYGYALPLKLPLSIRGTQLTAREGLIIHLRSDQSSEGFGEIAPLPGLSRETFEQAKQQVLKIRDNFIDCEIPHRSEHLNSHFAKWFGKFSLCPSVHCGLEMAVLNLIANTKNIPLHKTISHSFHDHVRINGLLQGEKNDVCRQAEQLIQSGVINLKLKVSGDIDKEIDKVNTLSNVINGRALLHLDANQSWDLKKAVTFGNEVGCAAVDYIEEPFENISDIPEFFIQTTIPVALDETLQRLKFNDIKSIEGVDVLVLKPTVLGGFERTWGIAQEAKKFAIDSVISSSFESDIGLLALANLSGGCGTRDAAAGLDTGKWFASNLLKENLQISRGKIDVTQRKIRSEDINFEVLRPIEK